MRKFAKQVLSYRKTLWTLAIGSLLPTVGVRVGDELVSYGILSAWDGLGGPTAVTTVFSWMAAHPLTSFAFGVLLWLAIAAGLSERHIKKTSYVPADEQAGKSTSASADLEPPISTDEVKELKAKLKATEMELRSAKQSVQVLEDALRAEQKVVASY